MRINHTRVIKQANDIESAGGELKKVETSLQNLLMEIPSYWKGEAATAYIKVCDELKRQIHNTTQDISKTASEIKSVANRIQREDEESARRAKRLRDAQNSKK